MNSALVWKVKLCFAAAAAVTAGLQNEGQSAFKPVASTAPAKLARCESAPHPSHKLCGHGSRTLAAASSSALPSLLPGDE
jgi:hypothetical protein